MADFIHQRSQLGPSQGGQVLVPLNAGTEGIAAAANLGSKVATAGFLLDNRLRNARNTAERRRKLARAKKDYNDWFAARTLETDKFDTLRTDAEAQLKTIADTALEGVDDGELRELLGADFAVLETTELDAANSVARRQAIDFSVGALQDTLRTERLLAANAGDEHRFNDAVTGGLGAIDELEQTGLISKKDADARRASFRSAIAEDQVRMLVISQPGEVVKMLANPAFFPDMNPGDRNQFMTLAIRQRNAQLADEDRKARQGDAKDSRDRSRRHDTNFANGLVGVERNEIEFAELQRMVDEDEIDGGQFNTLRDKQLAWAADPPGDPVVTRELTMDAHRGVATLNQLYAAMQDGDVSLLDGNKIEDLIKEDSFTRTDSYRVAREALDRTFGIIPGGSTVLERFDAELSGRAMRELYTRVADGADPIAVVFGDDKEVGMLQRYRTTRSLRRAIETPRYKSTEEADDAFGRGELTLRQFENEIARHTLREGESVKKVGTN